MEKEDSTNESAAERMHSLFTMLSESWDLQAHWAHKELLDNLYLPKKAFHSSTILHAIKDELDMTLLLRFEAAPSIKYKLEFDKSPMINAYALKIDEHYYKIKITIGLIIGLFLVTDAILKGNNEHLSKMKEPKGIPAIRIMKSFACYLMAIRHSPFNTFLPKDDWTALLCYSMVCRSLEYICTHESSHILGGHLELIEESINNKLSLTNIENQFMESQADDHATRIFVKKWGILSTHHDYSKSPFPLGRGVAIDSSKNVKDILSYAICIAYIVMGQDSQSPMVNEVDTVQEISYPPIDYRLWRALKLSVGFSSFDYKELLNSVEKSLSSRKTNRLVNILSLPRNEIELQKYDAWLSQYGSRVLDQEKKWTRKIIIARSFAKIRKPNSYWGLNIKFKK
jgi:hypothetical protein